MPWFRISNRREMPAAAPRDTSSFKAVILVGGAQKGEVISSNLPFCNFSKKNVACWKRLNFSLRSIPIGTGANFCLCRAEMPSETLGSEKYFPSFYIRGLLNIR